MLSVSVRIFLRYLAAFLIARGYLSDGDASLISGDPELAQLIETGIGFACGAAAECWYYLARRFGWSK